MMKDRAFYVPGTSSESWNKVPPPVRVYVRNDCFDKVAPPLPPSSAPLSDTAKPWQACATACHVRNDCLNNMPSHLHP